VPVTSTGVPFRDASGDIERQLAVRDHVDGNGLAVQPAGRRHVVAGAAVSQTDAGDGSRPVLRLDQHRLVGDLPAEDHLPQECSGPGGGVQRSANDPADVDDTADIFGVEVVEDVLDVGPMLDLVMASR
jgi:hypothetical protein